jgi:bacterioferritin (cytochrome b1)
MKQRLIRVLVYEGTPEFIQDQLLNRGVKGSRVFNGNMIKEAIVGDFLSEVLDTTIETHDQD